MAKAAEWRTTEYHATVDVAEDGSGVIDERWELTAGEPARGRDFHGFRRVLQLQAPSPRGIDSRFLVEVLRVTDEQSHPMKYEARTWRGQLEIKVSLDSAPGATRTVQIWYSVRNLVRYYPGHDEIYWDLTGKTQDLPIERASATVMLPQKASEGLQAQAVVMGATPDELMPQVSGSNVQFVPWHGIGAHSGFVVNVVLPKGVFQPPSWWKRMGWFLDANPIVLLPLGALLLMWIVRAFKTRAPEVIATEYEPPAGLSPAEAGMLVDDRLDPRDITATLIDLAVRGYLRIEEDRDSAPEHRDYILRLLRGHEEWHSLVLHERTMMLNVFYGGQWTKLSSLRLRFSVAVPAMRAGVVNALLDKGMYRVDPAAVHVFRMALVVVVAGLFVIAQTLGLLSVFQSGWLALLSFAGSAALVYWFGRSITAKTLKGTRTCAQIEGFREFLARVDSDRLDRFSPARLEKYLPFAMALGVEHHWTQTFTAIARQVPDWFQLAGGEGFDAKLWAHRMDGMAQQARTAMTMAPRARSFVSHGLQPTQTSGTAAAGRP